MESEPHQGEVHLQLVISTVMGAFRRREALRNRHIVCHSGSILSLQCLPLHSSAVGHSVYFFPRHVVLRHHMTPHASHRGEELSTDVAPRHTVMALHVGDQRNPTSVCGAAYCALLVAAFNCRQKKDVTTVTNNAY